MHEVLVNHLGGLSLPRKSVVRLTDRLDMTLDVYRERKTTIQQQQQIYDATCTTGKLLDYKIMLPLKEPIKIAADDTFTIMISSSSSSINIIIITFILRRK